MIRGLSHSSVYVLDQDSAKEFYTGKLGFEVRQDLRIGEFRWLTVGPPDQPDLDFILMKPGPPQHDAETEKQIRELSPRARWAGVSGRPATAVRPTPSWPRAGSRSCRSRPNGRTGSKRCSATTRATGSASPSVTSSTRTRTGRDVRWSPGVVPRGRGTSTGCPGGRRQVA
ncbi:VOC family protein [Amycolatopsis viridis]|uniref:VOC family protein n=1 Tax=Amycolatopsis viridis TaxID=185678 RepID=UPI0028BE0F4B|nr:VOC family protein [Amycolatopsis viridis]